MLNKKTYTAKQHQLGTVPAVTKTRQLPPRNPLLPSFLGTVNYTELLGPRTEQRVFCYWRSTTIIVAQYRTVRQPHRVHYPPADVPPKRGT